MEQSDTDEAPKPGWWVENERLREEMALPPYEPPRFKDGKPTYTVTQELEAEYGCTIRFRGKNTSYPDGFDVFVDRTPVLCVGRHRDSNGNTVYEIGSEEFREILERELTD